MDSRIGLVRVSWRSGVQELPDGLGRELDDSTVALVGAFNPCGYAMPS